MIRLIRSLPVLMLMISLPACFTTQQQQELQEQQGQEGQDDDLAQQGDQDEQFDDDQSQGQEELAADNLENTTIAESENVDGPNNLGNVAEFGQQGDANQGFEQADSGANGAFSQVTGDGSFGSATDTAGGGSGGGYISSDSGRSKTVLYVVSDGVSAFSQPSEGSAVVATYFQGDPVVVTLQEDWAMLGDGRYLRIADLSDVLVQRIQAPNDWAPPGGQLTPATEQAGQPPQAGTAGTVPTDAGLSVEGGAIGNENFGIAPEDGNPTFGNVPGT